MTPAPARTVLAVAIGFVLIGTTGCRSASETLLDRTKRAFELAYEAVLLVQAGDQEVSITTVDGDRAAEVFVANEKLRLALDKFREAHQLQPVDAKINYDYAFLSREFGEAWDVIRLRKGDEAVRAQDAGRAAEAGRLTSESNAAWTKAQEHYVMALRLYKAVVQEAVSFPRDKHADSLLQAAKILVKLDRGIEDLEEARALFNAYADVAQIAGESKAQLDQILDTINQEIVNRRMESGGS